MNLTDEKLGQSEDYALDDILNEYRDTPKSPVDSPSDQPAPRRSSLPTEDEVRAYLAAYARGEAEPSFEPRRKAGPEPPQVDSRYRVGESRTERRTLRYGGEAVDAGADEDYLPPRAEGYIATNVAPLDEDEIPDEPVKLGLFRRIKDKYEAGRRAKARAEAEQRAQQQAQQPQDPSANAENPGPQA